MDGAEPVVEWPFIKGQKEGGDPAVGGCAADAGSVGVVNDQDDSSSQYEIVGAGESGAGSAGSSGQSRGRPGPEPPSFHHHLTDPTEVGSQFETFAISNAELASLSGAGHTHHHSGSTSGSSSVHPEGSTHIKVEPGGAVLKPTSSADQDIVHYSLASDALAPSPSGLQTLIADQEKLIRVYQAALEDNDNKLITVYEIKPESLAEAAALDSPTEHGGLGGLAAVGSKDVLVEIVPNDGGDGLLRADSLGSVHQHHHHRDAFDHMRPKSFASSHVGGSKRPLTNEELQVQLGASVPLPPEELAAVTNSAAHTVNPAAGGNGDSGGVAELRCTLCGFVSYSRDEIAVHCEEAHELYLCKACNLVFKKRASLQSHTRAKHNNMNLASYHGGTTPKPPKAPPPAPTTPSPTAILRTPSPSPSPFTPSPARGRAVNQQRRVANSSSIVLSPFQKQTGGGGPSPTKIPKLSISLATSPPGSKVTNGDIMPDIRDILAKNKAVLPSISPSVALHQPQQHQPMEKDSRKQAVKTKAVTVQAPKIFNRANVVSSMKHEQQPQQQHTLMLDSRLSDPQTRNQFNKEFAKKITSTGVGGPELYGIPSERLPSFGGTFRLDIRERPADTGDITSSMPNLSASVTSGGDPSPNGREMLYSYDIIDTGMVPGGEGATAAACKVICGICGFSNPRMENVLFHCEIDHKQYYCQNKRCQLGFSSWDSLMRHMKHTHRKDK